LVVSYNERTVARSSTEWKESMAVYSTAPPKGQGDRVPKEDEEPPFCRIVISSW
jgi:hypothetical protein